MNTSQFEEKTAHIRSINLQSGASFVSDMEFSIISVINVFELLASCVTFIGSTHTYFEDEIYDSIPLNIVEFAYGS